ncbi:uncharacterized protein [Macrobrachium rosenbergii]|uniref:uncharacterized protein isoform X2 n=1 Tax=Macrobrachium rosenbergii TaxID=79674 RepID=UPI0034D682D0
MSDTLDPSKLKAAELRAELEARGLDTEGNMPVLVGRLREALQQADDEEETDAGDFELEPDHDEQEDEDEEEEDPDSVHENERVLELEPEREFEHKAEHNEPALELKPEGDLDAESEPEPEHHSEAESRAKSTSPPREDEPSQEGMSSYSSPHKDGESLEEKDFDLSHCQHSSDNTTAKDEDIVVKEEVEDKYYKMGYEDAPLQDMSEVKEDLGNEYDGSMKIEEIYIKEELMESKQGPHDTGDRRGENRRALSWSHSPDSKKRRPEVEEVRVEDEPENDKSPVLLDWCSGNGCKTQATLLEDHTNSSRFDKTVEIILESNDGSEAPIVSEVCEVADSAGPSQQEVGHPTTPSGTHPSPKPSTSRASALTPASVSEDSDSDSDVEISRVPEKGARRLYHSTTRPRKRRIVVSDVSEDSESEYRIVVSDVSEDSESDYLPMDWDEDGLSSISSGTEEEATAPSTLQPYQEDAPSTATSTEDTPALTATPIQDAAAPTSMPTQDAAAHTATPSTSDSHENFFFHLTASQRCTTDKTVWSRKPLLRRCTATTRPATYTPGLTATSVNATSASDLLSLFIDADMLADIVRFTNQRIDILATAFKAVPQRASVGHTCAEEIQALIGILVQSGAKRDNKITSQEMWSPQHGCPLYRAAMNEKRFCFLVRALRFDDETTREERNKEDKMAAFWDIWEKFNDHCRANYVPSKNITIDEQLLAFRERCIFKYYMRNKPSKCGLKIVMACDAKSSYMLNGVVDLGQNRKPKVPAGKLGEHYTLRLCEPFLDSHRNITVDSWVTSLSLVTALYKRRTTLVGRSRKKGYVPSAMLDTRMKRPVNTSAFLFTENATMVSYKPKKDKVVLLLSSKHNKPQLGDKKKPKIIHFYNKTKRGVDVLDNMCGRYSCSRKTRRWPLCLFYGMVNIAVFNVFILSKLKDGCLTKVRRAFMHILATELVKPWAVRRLHQTGMKLSASNLIRSCFGITEDVRPQDVNPTPGPRTKKRCAFCPWKVASQTRTVCAHCQKAVCPHHSIVICNDCQE